MTPTTQRTLRETLAAAILSIVPIDENIPSARWHRVRSINDVSGPSPRTFLIRFLPGKRTDDGISDGDGWDQDAALQIWTGYGGLPDDEDGPTIDEDGRQLFCTFADLVGPESTGLHPLQYDGWVYDDETPGNVSGYHSFTVRYLVADQAG